jgi:site-specific DNA-methyltransferase (adenine-specific)
MLTWHPIKIKLADLKPFDRNPRTITDAKFESLKKSLDDLGEFKPLVVDFDQRTILSGNQRYRAMLEKYNLSHEVDCYIPSRELSEAEREKVVVVDNGHHGTWDYDVLANFSIDLGELDLDISIPDIELPEVEQTEGQCDDDEIPEVKHSVTRRGDLWVLGKHKCLCGDSTMIDNVERLMGEDKADALYTDPPYGINYDDSRYKSTKELGSAYWGKEKPVNNFGKILGDDNFSVEFILEYFKYCNEIFIWGGNNFSELTKPMGSFICWDKKNENQAGLLSGDFELCWSKKNHGMKMYRQMWCGFQAKERSEGKRVHPTQKPVDMAIWFFDKWVDGKSLVLDLFLGSGSTLIACEKTNRKCYGMELDEHYCDVIIERYLKFTGRDDVYLESTGEKYLDLKEKRDAKC